MLQSSFSGSGMNVSNRASSCLWQVRRWSEFIPAELTQAEIWHISLCQGSECSWPLWIIRLSSMISCTLHAIKFDSNSICFCEPKPLSWGNWVTCHQPPENVRAQPHVLWVQPHPGLVRMSKKPKERRFYRAVWATLAWYRSSPALWDMYDLHNKAHGSDIPIAFIVRRNDSGEMDKVLT